MGDLGSRGPRGPKGEGAVATEEMDSNDAAGVSGSCDSGAPQEHHEAKTGNLNDRLMAVDHSCSNTFAV